MNGTGNNKDISAQSVPQESSISKRARELMECVAKMRGETYTPPPPHVPRADVERRRREEQLQTHKVYFLYCCNRIKIGTSNHHLRRILRETIPYCPVPLWLIGTIPGGKIIEAGLHKRFEAAAIRDEWFDLSPEIRGFLCEDERRADQLEDAEDDYRDWLHDELHHQERKDADPCD